MSDVPTVLVIEDDAQVRRVLRSALVGEGLRAVVAGTGADGVRLATDETPGVVLLDLGLPDIDGVAVIRRIRARSSVPILVVSARGHEHQKVEALDAGADDYLTKPFSFPELLARVRAALRRSSGRGPASPDGRPFRAGDLEVDLELREVRLAGEPVHLAPIEYKLLGVLVENAGRVVTHQQLWDAVWGKDHAPDLQRLRVHVAHLRRKLEPSGGTRRFQTESSVGYRLRIDGD